MSVSRTAWVAMAAVLLSAAAGCSRTRPVAPQLSPKEAAAKRFQAAKENEKVLAAVTVAHDLLGENYVDEAQGYLEKAGQIIEAVYRTDRHAAKAASLWHGESAKIFRGEPYERCMTFLYKGLTYLLKGELENARNCFRSSSIQDAFAAESQFASDFFIANYLEALCEEHMTPNNPAAAEIVGRIGQYKDTFRRPSKSDNLLVLCETGKAPGKIKEGEYGERLVFVEGRDPVWAIEMSAGQEKWYVYDAGNLFYQAATRGGRFVDCILHRKAMYKKAAGISANVFWSAAIVCFVAASQQSSGDSRQALLIAGAGCAAVGVTLYIVMKMITPSADTRAILALPNRLYLRSCALPPGARQLAFRFYDRYMNEVLSERSVTLPDNPNPSLVLYLTEQGQASSWGRR